MRHAIYKLYWFLSNQLGIDFIKLIKSIRGLFSFFKDFIKFRINYRGPYTLQPCLHDKFDESGATRNEYFWQDLLVAQKIYNRKPETHLDIGSRIDGFIAHIASFMPVEIFDIRPLKLNIPNVKFTQIDLMNSKDIVKLKGNYSSISCLHTIEHFGLGRYGDTIDLNGYILGFNNIAELLQKNGILYLSTPIGKENIEFNANRIFNPKTILDLAKSNNLYIESMQIISEGYKVKEIRNDDFNNQIESLANERYNLGLFIFRKNK